MFRILRRSRRCVVWPTLAAWPVLCAVLACAPAAAAADDVSRIRSHSDRIVRAMTEAHHRSHTFRALSDRVRRADLIIYLESGRCAGVHVLSCLSMTSGANAQRYLRITIDTEHSQALIVQQIAHELQHAVELAGAPQVVDAATLRAFYNRIGTDAAAADTFETVAAVAVGDAVRSELRHNVFGRSRPDR
jgi:hypothetical protein